MPDDFESLVRRHQWAVCASAYSVLRDRARSEEVAQEAFLLAWQKLPAMAVPPILPGWICGIARNLARNAARRRHEPVMAADLASTETPLDAVIDRETIAQVDRAIGELGDHDRDVVVLYYRGERSISEVAQALQITEATARKRLQRGRDRLKVALSTVEAALRATRPGPAFTAACVAALAAGVGVRSAAAATSAVKPTSIALGIALAGVVGGAIWWTQRDGGSQDSRRAAVPMTGSADGVRSPATSRGPATVRKLDASAREALAALLVRAQGEHDRLAVAAGGGARGATDVKVYDFAESVLEPADPPPRPPNGPLSKTTIRYAIRGMQPFLLECVSASRARGHDLHGTLAVSLRLTGEPDLGTLVETVELGGDALARADHELVTCLRETLLALELAPMQEAGTWDVSYPLVIR